MLTLQHTLVVAGLVLAVSVLSTHAFASGQIGTCNNTIITNIMNDNAIFCPVNVLQTVQKLSPYVKFRVFPKQIADSAKCVTGVLQEPVDNVANFTITFATADEPSVVTKTDFVVAESKCGFVFKYIKAEQYTSFKIAFSYIDGISLGYYGCSEDSEGKDQEITYAVCLASTYLSSQTIINASLENCRRHMAKVTGEENLVILPDCTNE